jgi:soluble lytic murein transglycosylase
MNQAVSRWKRVAVVVCAASVWMAAGQSSKKHKSSTAVHGNRSGSGAIARGSGKASRGAAKSAKTRKGRATTAPKVSAESVRLSHAFTASAQLRPMAQQLVTSRSASAYAGVASYAASHPGDGSAAANLALGHAYLLDKRYGDAQMTFRRASQGSPVLADYADFLGAQAAVQGNNAAQAITLLTGFGERYPGSLFVSQAPVLLSSAYLAQGDPTSAVRALQVLADGSTANQVDYRLALAKAYQAAGNADKASALYRGLYLGNPLSPEAATAKTQLMAMNTPLTPGEKKQHADSLFNAKQYGEAAAEYRALQKNENGLSPADRDALTIYIAVCDLRLKKLGSGDVSNLPVTSDDTAALRMYLRAELARSAGKMDEQDSIVQQLMSNYPQSRWLEEALYSGGNMYLLKHDNARAIADYTALCERFPKSIYAPNSHWHAAWLNYRERRYPESAKLMDEQLTNYPGGTEIPGALYWRGRLYEDVEHNFGQALNYYKAVSTAYPNSYYAILGRARINVIGAREAVAPAPALASVRAIDDPHLTDVLPENDPHLIKARLLANAALNEYIRPEIQLSETSRSWGVLAEAEIYQSFGEDTRALQAMKRAKLPFFSLPVQEVPMAYWQLVFPRPYWSALKSNAEINGLDPYLVAALIRQESEFNPGAVSRANAYGLMQLLPSTGKMIAKRSGDKHFTTNELLDPTTNLKLGTIDLKNSINRYSGQVEYALAAYNAGDTPIRNWIAMNNYKDVPEWVESIPYTETREYVQGIMRNREMYRAIYSGR